LWECGTFTAWQQATGLENSKSNNRTFGFLSLIDFLWHTKPYFKFSWKMWQDREHDEGIISPLKKVPCVTYFFYIISNFQLRQCHGNNYLVIIYFHYPVTWQKLLWHHNVFLQTKNHLISTSEIPIDSLFQRNYYFCLC